MMIRFPHVDPDGWLLSLFRYRIQVSRFGAKYAAKNHGKRYAVQFFGRLWRMG
jgi:hypothetical protein